VPRATKSRTFTRRRKNHPVTALRQVFIMLKSLLAPLSLLAGFPGSEREWIHFSSVGLSGRECAVVEFSVMCFCHFFYGGCVQVSMQGIVWRRDGVSFELKHLDVLSIWFFWTLYNNAKKTIGAYYTFAYTVYICAESD